MSLLQLPFLKKNGISVLISCQDDDETLRDCVESFLLFGDEVVIITNQATDKSFRLAVTLEREYKSKVKHVDVPSAVDLYQNRQAGLRHAKYRWVMRCDADYIAYNDDDGEHSISNLRERVLSTCSVWPTAFFLTKVSLSMGWKYMYEPDESEVNPLKYIPSVYKRQKEARIYSQNPFLRFQRLGRWEGVPGIRWYRKVHVEEPFWFEVTIRTGRSLLYRKARTDWRQLGDYVKYPKLDDYMQKVFLPSEYPGLTVDEAAKRYIDEEVMPRIKPYDENRYFPLPERIKKKRMASCGS